MAWTQTDLDRIDAAIASGTLRVRTSDGRLVEYRSINELKDARALIQAAVDEANNVKRSRARRISTRTGW